MALLRARMSGMASTLATSLFTASQPLAQGSVELQHKGPPAGDAVKSAMASRLRGDPPFDGQALPQATGAARHRVRQDGLQPVGNALSELAASHGQQDLGQRGQVVLGAQAPVLAELDGPRGE